MSDRSEERHEELMAAIAEWNKSLLLSLLYRIEILENQTDEPAFTRLPPLNTDDEQKTAAVVIMERVSDLEARFGIDDNA